MTLRSCGDAFWGAALRAPLYLILLVGCAKTAPLPAEREGPQLLADDEYSHLSGFCEYRNVFVVLEDSLQSSDPRVEPLRRAILSRAAEELPRMGLRAVSDPSEGYWRLFADAWMGKQGNPLVHLRLRGELKLSRHLFVVMMADEAFPYRGGIGGSYNFVTASLSDTKTLDLQVETGMRWIWELDSEQINALCVIRSELIDEGWVAIGELRDELIKEMEQVRRERARASQEKILELEIDGSDESEFVK
jgi:hypothetical protein